MLETVREYALERLGDLGESSALRRRHADHYLSLVLAGKEVRRDPREVVWMDRLEADRQNVRAAFEFLLGDDPEAAGRLADGAFRFWYTRAHFEEGLRAFERVVGLGDVLAPADRGNALMYCAAFAFGRRELDRAGTLVEEALHLHRQIGVLDPVARALVLLGTIRTEERRHEDALEALEESVEIARRHGDGVLLHFALAHLFNATVSAGQFERARELGEESLTLLRSAGNTDTEASVLGNLGLVAFRMGDHLEAADRFAAALAGARQQRRSRSDPGSHRWDRRCRRRAGPALPTLPACSVRQKYSRPTGRSSSRRSV